MFAKNDLLEYRVSFQPRDTGPHYHCMAMFVGGSGRDVGCYEIKSEHQLSAEQVGTYGYKMREADAIKQGFTIPVGMFYRK